MTRRALQFSACTVLLGGLSLFAANYFAGIEMLWMALAAFGLTAIPALATFLWVQWTIFSAPEAQLLAGLGGSMVRMFVALGGGLTLSLCDPARFRLAFWLWLVGFYLVFLTLDITLLIRSTDSKDSQVK